MFHLGRSPVQARVRTVQQRVGIGDNCMKPCIKIIRQPYEEPYHLNLIIAASNGRQSGEFEFYINADNLVEIANELEQFPRHETHVYLFELGSEKPEDRFAYYFRFRLCTIDSVGHCAIHLRFNNNRDIPYREILEFCIPVEPLSLNRLGKLLRKFSHLKHEVLYWDAEEAKLWETLADAEHCLCT